jgi:hypothetical protein
MLVLSSVILNDEIKNALSFENFLAAKKGSIN